MKTANFQTIVTLAIAVTALYVARDVLLPLALAALLTFLLTPIVRRLERFRIPRVPAVLITVLVVAIVGGMICYGVAEQVLEVAARWPEYRQNIREKIVAASRLVGPWSEHVRAAGNMVTGISENPSTNTQPSNSQPTADILTQPPRDGRTTFSPPMGTANDQQWNTFQLLRDWFIPVLSPLATLAIVVVFTIFMLIEMEDLRNRFIVVCGVERAPGTTDALLDAGARVSRYLRMQVLINGSYGVALGGICWMVGLPNPLLWAGLGALSRFVPYAGAIVGAGLPIAMAVAVADGWTVVVVLAIVLVAMELIVANVLEPWLYGSSTGVSPSGILISAFFWTWLWGGVGLILATPLTVLLTIMGRQIPPLRFMTTLFSDEPPLQPDARLYQRLLAHDTHEAVRIVEEEFLEHSSPAQVADLLLQSVTQGVLDEAHGLLDRDRLNTVLQGLKEVESEFSESLVAEDWAAPAEFAASLLFAPARTEADATAAEVLASTMGHGSWSAVAIPRMALASDLARQITESTADTLVLCGVGPRSFERCRYVLRRLGADEWSRPIIVLILGETPPAAEALARVTSAGPLSVASSAAELMGKLEALARASRVAT